MYKPDTAILISIQPKWCEKIVNGEKAIEIRKTRPKLELPFKCYIYCTKSTDMLWILNKKERAQFAPKIADIFKAKDAGGATNVNGKVIGEFVCNFIYEFTEENQEFCGPSYDAIQLTPKELSDYANGKTVYGWHISDLVIYDKPKELSEFYRECPGTDDVGLCYECEKAVGDEISCSVHYELHLTRPPQSWCYVEEI